MLLFAFILIVAGLCLMVSTPFAAAGAVGWVLLGSGVAVVVLSILVLVGVVGLAAWGSKR